MNQKLETKRILLYLSITFLLTYAYCFGIVYPLAQTDNVRNGMEALTTLLIAAVMFFPAIGVLLTRLLTKEGFRNSWLCPHLKGNIRTYLLAYFAPGLLTLLGCAVYFLLLPGQLDPECGFLRTTLEAAGSAAAINDIGLSQLSLWTLILSQVLTALFLGPLMNFFACFGEEWGWRGYLLPKMAEKLPPIPMLLITGVIWGLWHAPLTAIGHNYGVGYPGFPFTGIAAMCGFCIVMGIFLSYVTLKTQSCIPAILGHGAINSIAAVGMYLTPDGGNPFLGPAPTGIIGALPFIATAAVMITLYFRRKTADNYPAMT